MEVLCSSGEGNEAFTRAWKGSRPRLRQFASASAYGRPKILSGNGCKQLKNLPLQPSRTQLTTMGHFSQHHANLLSLASHVPPVTSTTPIPAPRGRLCTGPVSPLVTCSGTSQFKTKQLWWSSTTFAPCAWIGLSTTPGITVTPGSGGSSSVPARCWLTGSSVARNITCSCMAPLQPSARESHPSSRHAFPANRQAHPPGRHTFPSSR